MSSTYTEKPVGRRQLFASCLFHVCQNSTVHVCHRTDFYFGVFHERVRAHPHISAQHWQTIRDLVYLCTLDNALNITIHAIMINSIYVAFQNGRRNSRMMSKTLHEYNVDDK